MIWWQFVIRLNDGNLPITMNRKYRYEHTALKALKYYKKQGISGCMVTLFENSRTDYGIKDTLEF